MRTLYLAVNACYSASGKPSSKLGDAVCMAYTARLMMEAEPHDRYIMSMNPKHPCNFVFDRLIQDYRIQVINEDWPLDEMAYVYPFWDQRRHDRNIHDIPFDTMKEFYLRIDGGVRQKQICGSEKGLGHRNIFEYWFFGQESSPEVCPRSSDFRPSAFGGEWNPTAPPRSVFVSPHAYSQGNDVFSEPFWRDVIQLLVQQDIEVTVNTPHVGSFGRHDTLIKYSYQQDNIRALWHQVAQQRLCLNGNTGIAWFAAAHGTPMIVGEPPFFWYMDFRMRQCGVPVVYIFDRPDSADLAQRVNHFLSP